MLYLSQLLGAPVEDPLGERIGKIIDIEVTRSISSPVESSSIATTRPVLYPLPFS